jgi:sugar phosphate permease
MSDMSKVEAQRDSERQTGRSLRMAAIAWVLTAIYYFYQYALRSSPSVMMPQLSEAGGQHTRSLSIAGLFYYGYAPFSLVAGAASDQLGPRRVLPIAAAVVGSGTLLFTKGRSRYSYGHSQFPDPYIQRFAWPGLWPGLRMDS